jgi:hypothetical protein
LALKSTGWDSDLPWNSTFARVTSFFVLGHEISKKGFAVVDLFGVRSKRLRKARFRKIGGDFLMGGEDFALRRSVAPPTPPPPAAPHTGDLCEQGVSRWMPSALNPRELQFILGRMPGNSRALKEKGICTPAYPYFPGQMLCSSPFGLMSMTCFGLKRISSP